MTFVVFIYCNFYNEQNINITTGPVGAQKSHLGGVGQRVIRLEMVKFSYWELRKLEMVRFRH